MLPSAHFLARISRLFALIFLPVFVHQARGEVVINEIFYNAPNDLDELEWVEILNDGTAAVDLSGWKISKAVSFTFPDATTLGAGSVLIVCKNKELFGKFYQGVEPVGEFTRSLSNSSDEINLKDASGDVVESVEYKDRAPWPLSPDGYSASLERICPSSAASSPSNWAPSVLSDDYDTKPSGSPGKLNVVFSETAPPVVSRVYHPAHPIIVPGSATPIVADVSGATDVALLFRAVEPGGVGEEVRVAMKNEGGNRYAASIPGQEADRIVRYRVEASGKDGALRYFPHQNEVRPAFSLYVSEPVQIDKIPVAHFFNVGRDEFKAAAEYRANSARPRGRGRFGGFRERREITDADRARMEGVRALRDDALATAWNEITLKKTFSAESRNRLLPAFRATSTALADLRDQLAKTDDPRAFVETLPTRISEMVNALRTAATKAVDESQMKLIAGFGNVGDGRARGDRGPWGFEGSMLRRFFDIERSWFRVSMNVEVEPGLLDKIHPAYFSAIESRDAAEIDSEDGRPDFDVISTVVGDQVAALAKELEVSVGATKIEELRLVPETPFARTGRDQGRDRRAGRDRGRGDRGFGRGGGNSSPPLRPQGGSAFIYTDADSGETQLFDFVNITQRKSGYKVRLHKDRPLKGMTSINVLYEPGEQTILNEALAYDLYRAAGNASQRAGYMRVLMDGKIVGHHLWFEQPNGAFFRRNDIDDGGNLYKVIWQGGNRASEFTPKDKLPTKRHDVVGRHEKKSNPHDGYDDLIELVEALDGAGDDEAMWKLIQTEFDVDQVINYFAVNSLISHWDGFFNNYFLYHDTKREKWTIYPWDQDSTWSQRGGSPEELYRMPLNFGAEGARPDGESEQGDAGDRGRRGGFGRHGFGWWREGGEISRPLLANPHFRERYLARLKALATDEFTDDVFGKRIQLLGQKLDSEVKLRADAYDQSPESSVEQLRATINSLMNHLVERQKFVLSQLEGPK